MCDFKPGDEVEKYKEGARFAVKLPSSVPIGTKAIVQAVIRHPHIDAFGLHLVGLPSGAKWGHAAENWRKVAKRSDTLTIESFLTIKPGFEEPRRRVVEPVKEGAE